MTEGFLKDCPNDDFLTWNGNKHLIGAGVKNLGFIKKPLILSMITPNMRRAILTCRT
jgi:hypothetical protein